MRQGVYARLNRALGQRRLCVALLGAVISAFVWPGTASIAQTNVPAADAACATPGNWFDGKTGRTIDRKDLFRDLADKKLYVPGHAKSYPALANLVGERLNLNHIRAHWDEILRLTTSISQGTVTASLMLRKLGSYPRQNGLAVALRELGRIERILFTLEWLQSTELRRRVQVGLNRGEAKNASERCSSIGWAKCATAASRTNAIVLVGSIWWLQQ